MLPPKALVAFINSYYRGVDEDDLREAGAETLAMAAISHLELGLSNGGVASRSSAIWNPDAERDGWSTPRTVVEVVTDDMPFLVDSLTMVLNGSGLSIHLMVHPVLHVQRDGRGRMSGLSEDDVRAHAESWQRIEVDRVAEPERLAEVRRRTLTVLDDVRVAVADWPQMRARATELAVDLSDGMPGAPRAEASRGGCFPGVAFGQSLHVSRRPGLPARARARPGPPGRASGHGARSAPHRRQAPASASDGPHGRDSPAGARTSDPGRHQGELRIDRAPGDVSRLHRGKDL